MLTPLQAQGGGAIPVMDKIQTNTDQNGDVWVSLMPGVYQTDVRPAWGQVGVTEFYFYVDPSNAVQSAFTNLLTATNNTYPPNQYAYSAQASDARYAPLPVTSNDVSSINPAQIYPPLPTGITNNQSGVTLGGAFGGSFNGNGSSLTNVNAANVVPLPNTNLITVSVPLVAPVSSAGIEDISFQANLASNIPPSILASGYTSSSNNWFGTFTGNGSGLTGLTNVNAARLDGLSGNSVLNQFAIGWMTNPFLEWWSADQIPLQTNMTKIISWTGRNGNIVTGNAWYVMQAISGHPAIYFDGTGGNILTNTSVIGGWGEPGLCTNQATIFCVFAMNYSWVLASSELNGQNNVLFDGMITNGLLRAYFSPANPWAEATGKASPVFRSLYPGVNGALLDSTSYQNSDNLKVYCVSWASNSWESFWNGKVSQYYPNGASYNGTVGVWPAGFAGTLSFGQLANQVWPIQAYLYEFLIFTNQLSQQTIDQINNYFMTKYGLLRNEIDFFGDSMINGGASSFPESWTYWFETNFPGYTINNLGIPGATSSQVLSNVLATVGSSCNYGKKLAIIWCNAENGGESAATITNNLIAAGNAFSTNGWLSLVVNPPSNGYSDTNLGGAFRSALSGMITNYIGSQVYNGCINLGIDPYVGYSNAFTNIIFYPQGGYVNGVGTHWTNAAYAETAPTAVGMAHSVLDPASTITLWSTNAPPPTTNGQWQAFVNGHLFGNSDGTWNKIY